jgi:hypothetical protein
MAQSEGGLKSRVLDFTANLGHPAPFTDREKGDLSTAQADTIAGAKVKEKASVCCGRLDKSCRAADDEFAQVTTGAWRS